MSRAEHDSSDADSSNDACATSPSATASSSCCLGWSSISRWRPTVSPRRRAAVFIFQSVAITGVLALGVTATLVVGGFDLSIGSVATTAMMAASYVMVVLEQNALVAVHRLPASSASSSG